MASQAETLIRLETLMEAQAKTLETLVADYASLSKQLVHLQRDMASVKADVTEMKPVTQQFTNIRMMALGMLTLLSIMGGTVFAIWQYARSVIVGS
jgi:prefoldin subunit 5